LCAVGCFVLAAGAVAGAVVLFGSGFAGPAPVALAASGGLIVAGTTLWRPPPPPNQRRDRYPM
jgi:hypothetical protein